MNENCTTMPVGKQLLDILGDKPDKSFSDVEMSRILELLVQSKELAIECRKAMGQESVIDEHELIDTLFAKKRTSMSNMQARMFTACMAQCCAEMLGWCIERVKQDWHVPYYLLRNFVLDASWSGFLGGRFNVPKGTFWNSDSDEVVICDKTAKMSSAATRMTERRNAGFVGNQGSFHGQWRTQVVT